MGFAIGVEFENVTGGGQMVDRPDEPNTVVETWWTASTETSPTLYLHHLATQVSVNLMIAV